MDWNDKWSQDHPDKVDGPPKNVVKYMVRLMLTEKLLYANLYRDGVRITFPMVKPVEAYGEVGFDWGIEQVQATIEHYPEMVEYFRRRLTWDSRVRYATSELNVGARTQVVRSRWTEKAGPGWKWSNAELKIGSYSTIRFRER